MVLDGSDGSGGRGANGPTPTPGRWSGCDDPEHVRVLHVDDDPDFADVAAQFLEREGDGLSVVTETSAADGLDRLAAERIDCIVSDYDMPETNGLEFLERVRAADREVPFILFTGKGSEEIASEAVSAGVTDYLQKARGTDQYAVLANRVENAVEQYRSRRALEASQRRLSLFIDQSPLGVIEWDEEFSVVRCNDAAEDILGYDEADLRGKSWEFIVPESDRDLVADVVADLLAAEGGYHSVNENVRPDGERVVCAWHNRVVTDDDGDTVAVFSQFQDVTDRRERERRIEALHGATRDLMAASSREAVADIAVETARDILDLPINSVYLYDADADVLEPAAVTDAARDLVGDPPTYEPGESLSWAAFESGEVRVLKDVSAHPDRYNPDTEFRSEIILPLGDHGVMYVASTEGDAFDEGDVSLARTLAANTEEALSRIERDRTLRVNQSRYRTLVDSYPDGAVFLFDEDLRFILAGGEALTDVGLTPDDVVGCTLDEVFGSDVVEVQEPHYRAVLDGEERVFEQPYDGEWYRFHLVPIDRPDATEGLVVTRNITESREHVRRLETLVSNLPGMVCRFRNEPTWPMEAVRGDVESLTGYTAEALERGEVVWGEDILHPDDRERMWTAVQRALDDGDSFEVTYRIHAADGSVRWLWERGQAVADPDGEPAALEGFVTDITDLKERERELERRNDRLDKFASIVSHDLRNPLNVVEGSVELTRETGDVAHLDRASRAVERMERLISDLLVLARQGETISDPEPVALATVVEECWGNVDTGAADLVVDSDAVVVADRDRLRQLLENLVRNSVTHGATHGAVTVTVGDLPDRSGFYVADDGTGIPPAERDRVFEGEYSLAEDGTGYGLAIVSEIADAHGWTVDLTESADGGARFEFVGVDRA